MVDINDTKIHQILTLLSRYDSHSVDTDSQKRLIKLVNEHGLDATAIAAGYTTSTLIQYIRVKVAPAINLKSVMQAEEVLKKLET